MLLTFSPVKITRCHFTSNYASGDGGAIYVATQSDLRVFDSEFMFNSAKNGGSVAVYMGDSLIESCSFTSGNASRDGGCIHLKAANVTMKQSNLSGCESNYQGGSVYVNQQTTLRLVTVVINDSYSGRFGGSIQVYFESVLFLINSTLIGRSSEKSRGIQCSTKSRVYLKSVLISSCSSSVKYGSVHSWKCNVTMDNITITDTEHAISAHYSNINILNSLAQNSMVDLLRAKLSTVTFWNLNISGARIELDKSVAEFRHTVFMTPNTRCPIRDKSGSNITLKSVYIPHTTNMTQSESGIVCKGPATVVQGNMSGKTIIVKYKIYQRSLKFSETRK